MARRPTATSGRSVNHLAHAEVISGLLPVLAPPARIVLLGSNTYDANTIRKVLRVAPGPVA